MQRGVPQCCQRGHHKVNTPHKGVGKRTAPAPVGANKQPRLQFAAPAHSRAAVGAAGWAAGGHRGPQIAAAPAAPQYVPGARAAGRGGGGGGGGGARGHDELGGMCRPRCPRRGRSGVARHGITASRRGRSGGRRRRAFDQGAMFVLQAQGSPRSRSHQRAVPMWAGSSNFRRRAPVSHEKQGPHHCRVAIMHLHPLRHLTYHQHRRPPSDGDPNPRSPLPPMSLPRPFAECNFAPLRAEGAQQLMLCSGVSEWPI